MNPILLICFAISVVHLCLGTAVFLKAPRDRTNKYFYFAILSMAMWMALNSASSAPGQDLEARAIFARLAYAAGMLGGSALTAFCVVFANKGNLPRKSAALILPISTLFIVLSFFPGVMLKEFRAGPAGAIEIHGPFRIPFYIALAGLFVYGMSQLYSRHAAAKFKEEKYQMRLLGAGIFIPAFVSLASFVILPYFIGASVLQSSIGPMSTVFFIILAGYATLRQGHFIEVDLALEYAGKLTGYSLEDLADFLGSNMEQNASQLRAWFGEKQPDLIEITLSGGASRTLELTSGPLTNKQGRPVGKVLLFFDISERKTLKEEIRASEEKYRNLVENADDIIYTLDLEGNFTFFNNKASERITGHKAEEWLGRNFRDLIAPGEEERAMKYGSEAFKGKPQRYEAKILHKSGKTLTLWNFLSPIVKDGKTVGFSIVARDITETKELEQKLKESEEKYRTLVEESDNIVYIVQDGRLQFINRAGIEILGYPENELCSDDFDLLKLIHPDDHSAVIEAATALLKKKSDYWRIEVRLVSKRGRIHDFILTGASLTYKGKQAIIGALVDITEKKKLQEQLIQSEKLASIDRLVSGVAHELNNPLAGIMGYAQLFSQNKALPPKEREDARKMFEASLRCKKIIQNLLSFAMKHEIKRADINVNEVLDKALELREYNLKTQNIEVQRRYQRAIETIAGDPHELLSVFLNLINNAAEAMINGAGRGILTITTRRKNGAVEVEFEDNGPGIPPRFQDKVFDPFFTTKEVGEGVGLGLSISYGIIKEHGGELLLDKSYSGGSRFTVNLPLNGGSRQEVQVADFAPTERSPDSRHRILVVDDEETILDLSVDILTENGYHVETASTGEIAKEMIESEPYDLVIADIRMPGKLSGIDLFNWARQNRPGMEERIVFATGDIVAKDTQKFLSETKRPCLSKPFEMSEYLETIRSVLALASGNGD